MSDTGDRLSRLKIDRDTDADPARGRWGWVAAAAGAGVITVVLWLVLGGNDVRAVETVVVRAAVNAGTDSVLDATGYVVARRLATVSSKFTGKVAEVYVEEGMRVQSGQVLARLDASTETAQFELARARLESARAALAEIRVLLEDARRTLRRTEELARRGLASQSELDTARADVEALEARLQSGEQEVRVAERSLAVQQQLLDDTVIRAPFGGVVVAKTAQPGEMISPVSAGGGFTRTGICTIVDMDSLEIEVDVNEAYIQRVKEGQPVVARLDAYPDWEIPSEVIAIVPTADRQKATVKVRIGFLEKDERVLPDMGVRVAFLTEDDAPTSTGTAAELSIPVSALFSNGGEDAVFVVLDGVLELRIVRVSRRDDRRAWIAAGLKAGERIVSAEVEQLSDGMQVSVN